MRLCVLSLRVEDIKFGKAAAQELHSRYKRITELGGFMKICWTQALNSNCPHCRSIKVRRSPQSMLNAPTTRGRKSSRVEGMPLSHRQTVFGCDVRRTETKSLAHTPLARAVDGS